MHITLMLGNSLPAGADGYCFQEAGIRYGISPILLRAISEVESNGEPHAINMNPSSQTMDMGHMQINSFWRKHLGEDYASLYDACYCTMVGAWILRQCMDRYGYGWDGVACYHTGVGLSDAPSGRKRRNGRAYIEKISQKLTSMME
ncbi:MAG: lytic transglycosylase domain-containing protein [Thermodesulfobacteriota bacterium]